MRRTAVMSADPGLPALRRRFGGQARLVRLLLWRIGDSTDIDACLEVASSRGMIEEDDVSFLEGILGLEEAHRSSSYESDELDVSEAMVSRLQRCADKLNRADSA